MGEYVKYKSREVKIGTMESMYYVSYPKYARALHDGMLKWSEGNGFPYQYADINSGFRFRFPFPDEDRFPFGDIGDFHFLRELPILLDKSVCDHFNMPYMFSHDMNDPSKPSQQTFLGLAQQKLVTRESDDKACLVSVFRNPVTDELFRIEDDNEIAMVLTSLVRNHILNEPDPAKQEFYRLLGSRILKGYRIEESQSQSQETKKEVERTRLQNLDFHKLRRSGPGHTLKTVLTHLGIYESKYYITKVG